MGPGGRYLNLSDPVKRAGNLHSWEAGRRGSSRLLLEKEWAEPVVTLWGPRESSGGPFYMLWLLSVGEGTKVCTALQTEGAL